MTYTEYRTNITLTRVEFELSSNLGGLGSNSLHGGNLGSDQVRKMLALIILHDRRADVEGVILKASLCGMFS